MSQPCYGGCGPALASSQCTWWIWLSVSSVNVKKGEQHIECLWQAWVKTSHCLTSGPSGYCPLTVTGPGRPRVGVRAPICCKATQWTGRTAGCGTGWRNQLRPPPWRSCLFERCRRHSGFLFAAKGLGRHQGMTGLKQEEERGERGDSWGPLGTTGSPLGFIKPRTGGKVQNHIWAKHERHRRMHIQRNIWKEQQQQWVKAQDGKKNRTKRMVTKSKDRSKRVKIKKYE